MAGALDLAITAWSPLGMGVLTGKYANGAAAGADGRLARPDVGSGRILSQRNHRIAETVSVIAAELAATPAQVALAWLLGRPGIVLPIVGVRKETQVRENLAAVGLRLDPEHLARLETASRIDLGFPHEFITGARDTSFVLGDTIGQLDNHRQYRSGLPTARDRLEPSRTNSSRRTHDADHRHDTRLESPTRSHRSQARRSDRGWKASRRHCASRV